MFIQNKEDTDNQEILKNAVKLKDFEIFKKTIENKNIQLGFERNILIRMIALYNREDFFFYIFNSKKSKEVDFSSEKNYCIRYFSENGNFKVVSALLTLKYINPSDFRNLAIRNAYSNENFDVVDLLWSLDKVQESLKEDDPDLYQKLLQRKIIKNVKNF